MKSEKVDVVEYVKECWGFEVKEVSDIYEVVYYFIGYVFLKLKVLVNVFIDIFFFKDDVVKDYQNIIVYYESVREKFKKSNVDYMVYIVFKEVLDQVKVIFDGVKEVLDFGMYYMVFSKNFQVRIVLRYVDWYISVESLEDVVNFLISVNFYINQIESFVLFKEIRGMMMFQVVVVVEERVEDVKVSL